MTTKTKAMIGWFRGMDPPRSESELAKRRYLAKALRVRRGVERKLRGLGR